MSAARVAEARVAAVRRRGIPLRRMAMAAARGDLPLLVVMAATQMAYNVPLTNLSCGRHGV